MCGGWSTDLAYWAEDEGLGVSNVAGQRVSLSLFSRDPTMIAANKAAGLNTWGNSADRTDLSTVASSGESDGYFLTGEKYHLLGISMGGALSLNWAKANPTKVSSIALILPCVDIQSLWDRDPAFGMKASINTAYGGRPPDADNPADNTSSFTGFPIKIWYSLDDPINLRADVEAFAYATGASLVSMGSIGHTFNTGVSGSAVADFFNDHDGTRTFPTVTTSAESGVTTSGATLNGTVNPNSIPANYYWQYSRAGHRSKTTTISAGSGSSPSSVPTALTGLDSGRNYEYRLVAYSSVGVSSSDWTLFFTNYDTHDPRRVGSFHAAGRIQ